MQGAEVLRMPPNTLNDDLDFYKYIFTRLYKYTLHNFLGVEPSIFTRKRPLTTPVQLNKFLQGISE